jgi:hypothetical protein
VSKPSWEDAPPWAKYLSWDEAGDGGSPYKWHEAQPQLGVTVERWLSTERHMIAYPAPRHKTGYEWRPD